MKRSDVVRLACPRCHGALVYEGTDLDHALHEGVLECRRCVHGWPVRDGLPRLYDEARVPMTDRLFRLVYDVIAPFHDLGVRWVLPLLQGSSEDATRAGYVRRMQLDDLRPDHLGEPVRILEVGIGGGANVERIERALPFDVDAEIWGVDLSEGMIAQAQRTLRGHEGRDVTLALADAHALPFPDGLFDRVFHVGAIASYGDQARALAEMARVARPGTPIVVVDEQLDEAAGRSPFHWLAFRALTIYDLAPHAPVEHLPAGATNVTIEQVSRFYYCMTFSMPPSKGGRTMPPTQDVTKLLSDEVLAALRAAYVDAQMVQALSAPMPAQYPGSEALVEAIQAEFYGEGKTLPTTRMSNLERERVLIALLASRGGKLTLAIHLYAGLMAGASPSDLASILLLAGVYTGIDRLAEGLAVQRDTFTLLAELFAQQKPLDAVNVCRAISGAYRVFQDPLGR
jgi:ubiquinone/menaquinone biosynthesis C-methylase UbiE/uncharacterized protein YbaR (Trm112 family)/alkylhydroperoxidase/carboxymuconolactone decarboxylase family protein YurZ